VYAPAHEFNVNVKDNKHDFPAVYLMKKNPYLPFGSFSISVVFNELGEHESQYVSNTLEFDDDTQAATYKVKLTPCKTDELVKVEDSEGDDEHEDAAGDDEEADADEEGEEEDDEAADEETPAKDS
jgi:hypothetical protein